MVANTRSSTAPTITIVEPIQNGKKTARNCCGCIPVRVGVFAILSLYFFLGIASVLGTFSSLVSFASLDIAGDAGVIALCIVNGSLYASIAIVSVLSIGAIKKEKVVMMRRLSIAFWIITALTIILDIIVYILQVGSRSSAIAVCKSSEDDVNESCDHIVDYSLIGDAIKTFVIGMISIYFAYVIFRYARQMKETQNLGVLPLAAPINGQKTPTYFVYSTQPPTSSDWVPPPTYSVRPTNPLPDDFNPDSKH